MVFISSLFENAWSKLGKKKVQLFLNDYRTTNVGVNPVPWGKHAIFRGIRHMMVRICDNVEFKYGEPLKMTEEDKL
jgi:hypothetical protein